MSAATAAAMMATTASAAASFRRASTCRACQLEMGTPRDLWSDYSLIMSDFVWIDFAVVIDIEEREKAVGVLLHLLKRQPSIMVAIGLAEPVGKRVVVVAAWPERFAHRADEHASMVHS